MDNGLNGMVNIRLSGTVFWIYDEEDMGMGKPSFLKLDHVYMALAFSHNMTLGEVAHHLTKLKLNTRATMSGQSSGF